MPVPDERWKMIHERFNDDWVPPTVRLASRTLPPLEAPYPGG